MMATALDAGICEQVLVTGGAGFIGSHLVEKLVERGAEVCAIDNLQAGTWSNTAGAGSGVLRLDRDVRDIDEMRGVLSLREFDVVFHLAANASVPGSVDDPAYDFETNCRGTFVLLDAIRELSPRTRVVFASSGAVYGEPEAFPIKEETPLKPISPYGASKLAGEVECRMFHEVYGIPIVIGRIFNSYGPGMPRFVILDFLRKLREDERVLEILGNGKQMRDFNYVEDTVQGLLLVARDGYPGQAYNIASGNSVSVTDLAEMLLRILGLENKTRVSYTGESWIGDAQHWEVDTSEIRRLGYEPAVDLVEGLKRTIEWFEGEPK